MNLSALLFANESLAASSVNPHGLTEHGDLKKDFHGDENIDVENVGTMGIGVGDGVCAKLTSADAMLGMRPSLMGGQVKLEGPGMGVGVLDAALMHCEPQLHSAFTNGFAHIAPPPTAERHTTLYGVTDLNVYSDAGLAPRPVAIGKKHKMKREWRNIGWYTSDAAMNEVRKREKVSKRKSVAQINGTKVFYRCNNWRRTNCNFRMFAMYYAADKICLNASGEHDHAKKNPHYVPRNYRNNSYDISPCSSQQQVLNQLVMNATANSSYLFENMEQESAMDTSKTEENENSTPSQMSPFIENAKAEDERSAEQMDMKQESHKELESRPEKVHIEAHNNKEGSQEEPHKREERCGESPSWTEVKIEAKPEIGFVAEAVPVVVLPSTSYQLSDGNSIAQLLQIAAEMGHKFTFNARRTGEYCFESNTSDMNPKMVVFADQGNVISVTVRCGGRDQSQEEWTKADWRQFLWAVRGKCMNALKGL